MDYHERQSVVMSGGGDYSKTVEEEDVNICEIAPYPWCNGAEGCDTCEYGGGK